MGRTTRQRNARLVKCTPNTAASAASGAVVPKPVLASPIFGNWIAADAAVVGSAHLRGNPPKPCQDAALADSAGRALIVLADGAGSAAVSHLGAAAVIAGVRRLCRTLAGEVTATLDTEKAPTGRWTTLSYEELLQTVKQQPWPPTIPKPASETGLESGLHYLLWLSTAIRC